MAEAVSHALARAHRASRVSVVRRYGALALALYLLATSKWGSYLLPGPPYVADLLLAGLIAERALAATTPVTMRRHAPLVVAVAGLLVWSGLTLAADPVDVVALRDAAPYLYAVVVFLVGPMATAQKRVSRWITIALVFHAAWVSVDLLAPGVVNGMPLLGGDIRLFSTRNDFDGLVCAVLAALALHRALSGRFLLLNLALGLWGATLAVSLESRAAVLALVVMLLVTLALFAPARRRFRADGRVAVAVILLALPALAVGAVSSSGVQRLMAGLDGYIPYVSTHGDVGAARGTARARRQSWQAVRVWLEADTSRTVRGVGFGPDFLHESGGDRLLLGGVNQEVRSPHNYFLNTWARLGLIGLALSVVILLIGLRLARKVARGSGRLADADVLAVLLIVGAPAAAAVGVILESPFGALPYFWALGHLAVRAGELGAEPERRA